MTPVISGLFTFHNVSISTDSSGDNRYCSSHLYIPQCIYFYTVPLMQYLAFLPLHSTMYLFLRFLIQFAWKVITLYIPQCIYFYNDTIVRYDASPPFTFHNVSISTPVFDKQFSCDRTLYIPQCIYFYKRRILKCMLIHFFTFHNVSISTYSR